ncbi:MAG: ThuA domain-containing protein [Planctomycetaceae bacterium]
MRPSIPNTVALAALVLSSIVSSMSATAAKPSPQKPLRLLLLWHSPDGHPRATHEYQAGMRIIAKALQPNRNLQAILVHANSPWPKGPELLDGADGAALFVSEGAKWISDDPKRLAAFQRLARRGGGLAGLHWGIGTRKAEPIAAYLALLGGCHGGPDRKYSVVTARATPATAGHPVLRGIRPFEVRDEFYYRLKFSRPAKTIIPLLRVPIDGRDETVAWSWQRSDGGRSFGFSGLHFHENWKRIEYRRLVVQGILWTLGQSIPEKGLDIPIAPGDLKLPRKKSPR